MKTKVRTDKPMRQVKNLAVRFDWPRSLIMLNILAPRLIRMSPSNITIMIFAIDLCAMNSRQPSLREPLPLSI
jgi:hypothetical protein